MGYGYRLYTSYAEYWDLFGGKMEMKLNKNELLQIYEWFYYIRSSNFAHLSDEDRKLATKIRKEAMKQCGLKDK
ncbi:hypothetical protein [Bacillus pseudomycoides]|uniref:hypothetical protein n=1 Tax=Bacillus pseudomycoides TaxID=64104 RepID=UPI000BEDC6B2|nr:hypothetical protein [Bacillus pseudomycoides]PDY48465.1 hypothetical protein CON79_04405 [Bacillus pseudomycoides]PHB44220.1 hypothetical protein COE83_18860 [Bacillus pseudomycoides]